MQEGYNVGSASISAVMSMHVLLLETDAAVVSVPCGAPLSVYQTCVQYSCNFLCNSTAAAAALVSLHAC